MLLVRSPVRQNKHKLDEKGVIRLMFKYFLLTQFNMQMQDIIIIIIIIIPFMYKTQLKVLQRSAKKYKYRIIKIKRSETFTTGNIKV